MQINRPLISDKYVFDSYGMTMAYASEPAGLHYRLVRAKEKAPKGMLEAFKEQLNYLPQLPTPAKIADYYRKATSPWLPEHFHAWYAQNFRFNPDWVTVGMNDDGTLAVDIQGPTPDVLYYQFMVMPIINALANVLENRQPKPGWEKELMEDARVWRDHKLYVANMGLRRRFSSEVERRGMEILIDIMGRQTEGGYFLGASHVSLAAEFGVKPIGTKGHDRKQYFAAKYGYRLANRMEREDWLRIYPTAPGYDLPDTWGIKAYMLDQWDPTIFKFMGQRQDYRDPIWFTNLFAEFYGTHGLNPANFSMIYTNRLDRWTPVKIAEYNRANNLFKPSFGIGTRITNNVGWPAPDYTIKLWAVSFDKGKTWVEVCKRNQPEKTSGSEWAKSQCDAELGPLNE